MYFWDMRLKHFRALGKIMEKLLGRIVKINFRYHEYVFVRYSSRLKIN
jgi:hypothetical protein